ncbi:hypothetical protein SprV_0200969700 [Sparganum proliferum]
MTTTLSSAISSPRRTTYTKPTSITTPMTTKQPSTVVAAFCNSEEIKGYADRSEWTNFFPAIKAASGPPTKGTAPLLSAVGSTLLTKKTRILQHGPSTSEASSTVLPPSPTPPSPV